eukprot:TRINITY_DN3816_c0_g1_i1.p1 TRINITY_DN3816_c0_g1~~TRINITY_DN3816_c0_g1_i1.p1  ORF type:complete len:456 (+),score=143.81 TRINITY_DN3816_c0_g1_i1:148-1515(+)
MKNSTVDQSQKNILIRNLQAENDKLRVVDISYKNLSKKLIELERQFNELQEEKRRNEREFKEWLANNTTSNARTELQSLQTEFNDKQGEVAKLKKELSAYIDLLNEKDKEIEKLYSDQMSLKKQNKNRLDTKSDLERKLEVIKVSKLSEERNSKDMIEIKEKLSKDCDIVRSKKLLINEDKGKLKAAIEEAGASLAANKRKNLQDGYKLEDILVNERTANKEIKAQSEFSEELVSEREVMVQKIKEMEAKLEAAGRQYVEAMNYVGDCDEKIREYKAETKSAQARELETQRKFLKLRIDNEVYRKLLQEHKADAETQKKLKALETARKYEAEHELNKLEKESLVKEMTRRSIVRELEQVKESHNRLLEDRRQLSEGVETLMRHAEILQSQNKELHNELEQFVETDEKVRKELALRGQFESPYSRQKGMETAFKASSNSQSPDKWSATRASYTPSP